MIRQVFGKESTSHTRMLEWHARFRADQKGETGQEHAHNFLWHQWDCSQTIHPGRPNSQFCILLWHFMVTVWRCVKTLPQTLVISMTVIPHPPYLLLFPRLKIKLKGRHFDTAKVIDAESQAALEHSHRTWIAGYIKKLAEALRTEHTHGKRLLWGWWLPVGLKF
jgi:hypothetical protein